MPDPLADLQGITTPPATPPAEPTPPTPPTPEPPPAPPANADGTPATPATPPAEGQGDPANEGYRNRYNQFVDFVKKAGGEPAFTAFKNGDTSFNFNDAFAGQSLPANEPGAPPATPPEPQAPPEGTPPPEGAFDPFNKGQMKELFREAAQEEYQAQSDKNRQIQVANAVARERQVVAEEFAKFADGVPADIIQTAIQTVGGYNIDVTKPGGWASSGQAMADQVDMLMARRGLVTLATEAEASGQAAGRAASAMAQPAQSGEGAPPPSVSENMQRINQLANARDTVEEFLDGATK